MRSWAPLSGHAGRYLVLAVDFDATGRHEATFRDLAGQLPADVEVWQTVLPSAPQDLVSWWTNDPALTNRYVHAVVGYCAGGVLACAVADDLAKDRRRRPDVLLFNPGPPTIETLDRDFRAAVDGMNGLDASEHAALRKRMIDVRSRHGEDFAAVSAGFAEVYRDAVEVSLARLGVDGEVADELTALLRMYLNYLDVARDIDWRPELDDVAYVSSDHYGSEVVSSVLVEVSRADLLRSSEVARATTARLVSREVSR